MNYLYTKGILEEILAVLLLEYHDKNLLSGDNKTRNEWMRKRVIECIGSLKSNTELDFREDTKKGE
jgi:hypothetical protein